MVSLGRTITCEELYGMLLVAARNQESVLWNQRSPMEVEHHLLPQLPEGFLAEMRY